MKRFLLTVAALSCLAVPGHAQSFFRDPQVRHAELTSRRDMIMSREHFGAERRDAILARRDMAHGDVRDAIIEERRAQRNLTLAHEDAHASRASSMLAQREIRRDVRRDFR